MKRRIYVPTIATILAFVIFLAGCANPATQTTSATLTGVNSGSSKSANGLSLSLSLDSNTYQSGQGVAIIVDEMNTLSKTNNVSISDQWPLGESTGLLINMVLCNAEVSPFRIAIFQGEYTSSDFKTAAPLILSDPKAIRLCTMFVPPTAYAFKPFSDIAVVSPSGANDSSPQEGEQIRAEETLKGYWSNDSISQFNNFDPGVYTVVAGDEWGSLVVLHFTVTATNTTDNTNGLTEWKSKMLADNFVFGPGIAVTIDGKNYLICNVNFGTNPEGSGTNADAGIVILDIGNPDNPDEIAYLKAGQDEYVHFEGNLKLNGDILYVLTYNYLWIIDVSDPFHPKDMGKTPLTGAISIEVSGQYAYIASSSETGGQALNTLDISDPIHPHNVAQITMQSSLNALQSSGSLLFALAGDGLYIFDISVPGSLKQIGFLSNPFPPLTGVIAPEHIPPEFFDMALAGNDLYLVSGIDKMLVVDISNPAAPKIITTFEMGEQGTNIIISGEMAYLLSCNGAITFSMGVENLLAMVDISNPGQLNEFSSVLLSPTFSNSYNTMIEAGNHLYFCDNRYPVIQIMDLESLIQGLK